ncbi:MAG: cytochrome c3 family protein [Deltaproteobacteria bacterium]|nr:cytochrome c3 family protein [Deltaproteobacteria bacterium]
MSTGRPSLGWVTLISVVCLRAEASEPRLASGDPRGASVGDVGVEGSVHDLLGSRTGGPAEVCSFCHAPRRDGSAKPLWGGAAASAATWGGQGRTSAGTLLPAQLGLASKQCLSCHDGTVTRQVIAHGADLAGNHPISIPYAGQPSYNGIASAVEATTQVGGYWSVASAGCSVPTGACTTAAGGGLDGARISLAVDPRTGSYGVECTSCHEPHNELGNPSLLRVSMSGSALCRSCHDK